MSEGAIKALKDRRGLHLMQIAVYQTDRAKLADEIGEIDKNITRCERVVSEMEEGITALGGTID